MPFSDNIPELILEFPNTRKFVSVLDGLYQEERSIINSYTRLFNPLLLTNKKWLIKILEEYGFFIPYEFPIEIMQNILINANAIMESRGSLKGVEFFCSAVTLGEVTVNGDNFYQPTDRFLLDTTVMDTIVEDTLHPVFYLSDSTGFTSSPSSLEVTIQSIFYDGTHVAEATSLTNYLRTTLPEYLGFNHLLELTITEQSRATRFYHELLNNHFYE